MTKWTGDPKGYLIATIKDIDETFRKCVLGLELGMAKTKPGTKLNREYAAALKQIKRQYKATMKSLRTSAK
jgi:hypothetical protein